MSYENCLWVNFCQPNIKKDWPLRVRKTCLNPNPTYDIPTVFEKPVLLIFTSKGNPQLFRRDNCRHHGTRPSDVRHTPYLRSPYFWFSPHKGSPLNLEGPWRTPRHPPLRCRIFPYFSRIPYFWFSPEKTFIIRKGQLRTSRYQPLRCRMYDYLLHIKLTWLTDNIIGYYVLVICVVSETPG